MNSQPDLSSRLAIDTQGVDTLRQSARQNSPQSVKAVAQQFEALFMNTVMKSMREASTQEGGVFDNQQSKMFTGMLDQQLSQNMAKRGVGLADVLIRQLSPHGVPSPEDAAKNPSAKNGAAANVLASAGSTASAKPNNASNASNASNANNSTLASSATKAPLKPSLVNNPYLHANKVANTAANSAATDVGAVNNKAISPAKAKLLADIQAMSEMDASLRIEPGKVGDDFSQLLSMNATIFACFLRK
ncbi:MAG: rod-binding protein [Burkholderiales bacterium]|nr:rod-binding protein [Burkholderiales bacterium]